MVTCKVYILVIFLYKKLNKKGKVGGTAHVTIGERINLEGEMIAEGSYIFQPPTFGFVGFITQDDYSHPVL